MSIISLIKYAPKRTLAVIAMLAAAAIVPATLLAYGPTNRATFTAPDGAPYVTFNSITNGTIGDERNFVGIRENTGTNSGIGNVWYDNMTVAKDKTYLVRMYVHNDAVDPTMVAHDVTAEINLPTTTAKSIEVQGFVRWSGDTAPTEVWDEATFSSNEDFNLAYVSGSLKYENNSVGKNGGIALPESIFTSAGTKLGYDSLNGDIPGCFQYAGYVTFVVKPQFAPELTTDFTLQKMVSKHGANKWVESYTAQPGEIVDYLLVYKNTGETQENDVTFRDTLPADITYKKGTTTYGNTVYPKGTPASDNVANGTGINVGNYAVGANAWVIFSAEVAKNGDLDVCGENTLINKAKVTTNGLSINDTANVVVNKTCDTPKVVYTCDSLGVAKLSNTSNRFTVGYSLTNATFKNVSYVIRNAAGAVVETKTATGNTLDYNQATVGKYSVQATITVTADNKQVTATSESCKANFEVTSTPVEPPVTPNLPYTGPGEDIAAFLGVGSLVTALGYYLSSRRGLLVR